MFEYIFSQSDFNNATNVDSSELQDIIVESSISTDINYIMVSKNGDILDVKIYFEEELSTGDFDILTTIVNIYQFNQNRDTTCVIKDIKSAGTNGGTFEKDTWVQRTLNTVEGNVSFLSLNNNQITLNPGRFYINIKSPTFNVQNNQIRLANITDSTYIYGTNAFSASVMTNSELTTFITITEQKVFEIEHICSKTNTNDGFGRATGFDSNEVYTTVVIQRI